VDQRCAQRCDGGRPLPQPLGNPAEPCPTIVVAGHRAHVVALGRTRPLPTAPEEAVIEAVDPDVDPDLGVVDHDPGAGSEVNDLNPPGDLPS